MADDILKSYLVSIGFKVDEADYKKFKDSQLDTEKRTKDLSKAFADFAKIGIGSATALGGMVIKVSSSLENLHFQAQKSGTSARNLKSFGEAAEQIGIQAEDAMGLVKNLNNIIQKKPQGETAFLSFLGIDAKQDKTKVLLDLVDKLAEAPVNARIAYGEHFGLNVEDLNTLIRGRQELHKFYQDRQQVNENINAQALAAHKAQQEFRNLEDRFLALTNTVGTAFLSLAKDVVSILEVVVKNLIEADKVTDGWSSKLLGLGAALGTTVGALKALGLVRGVMGLGGATATEGAAAAGGIGAGSLTGMGTLVIGAGYLGKKLDDKFTDKATRDIRDSKMIEQTGGWGWYDPLRKMLGIGDIKKQQTPRFGSSTYSDDFLRRHPILGMGVTSTMGVKDLINKYAAQFGVDPNLLQAQAWQESRLNPKALSSKGAIGVMQLMPSTAKLLGVDPFDTESNISGGARMMAGLLKKYHGNTANALAAYNAGEGAVDRAHGVPKIAETQDYVAAIQRRMISQAAGNTVSVKMDQKTDVNVYGSGDASKAADLVAKNQEKINSGLARDFAGAVQ